MHVFERIDVDSLLWHSLSHYSRLITINVFDEQMCTVGRNSTTPLRRLSGPQGHVLQSADFRRPLSMPNVMLCCHCCLRKSSVAVAVLRVLKGLPENLNFFV